MKNLNKITKFILISKMKRTKSVIFLSTLLCLFTVASVQVYATGLLEIDPTWPTMTDPDETFEIYVKNGGIAHYPQLFLVMTETCWDDLSWVKIDFNKDTTIEYTLSKGDFDEAVSGESVPTGYPPGMIYTVASLKDHLGIDGTELSIYWTLVPFPTGDTINGPTDKYRVHIDINSADTCMLVYVYAKSENSLSADYDMRVPPTNPGFMVPEPATIAAIATPMLTLIGYALYKKKSLFS